MTSSRAWSGKSHERGCDDAKPEFAMSSLVLKRASTSRSSGEWNDDDFDVLADGVVVGRIMKAAAVPVGMS